MTNVRTTDRALAPTSTDAANVGPWEETTVAAGPLVPCPACRRHVFANARACPFCRVELDAALASRAAASPRERLARTDLARYNSVATKTKRALHGDALASASGGVGGLQFGPATGGQDHTGNFGTGFFSQPDWQTHDPGTIVQGYGAPPEYNPGDFQPNDPGSPPFDPNGPFDPQPHDPMPQIEPQGPGYDPMPDVGPGLSPGYDPMPNVPDDQSGGGDFSDSGGADASGNDFADSGGGFDDSAEA